MRPKSRPTVMISRWPRAGNAYDNFVIASDVAHRYANGMWSQLTVVLVFVPILVGQEQPNADDVVRRVALVYSQATQYHLVGEVKFSETRHRDGAIVNQATHRLLMAMQEPDKVHAEMTPAAGEQAIYVTSDGRTAWAYSPNRNEYMKLKPGPAPKEAVGESDVNDDGIVPYAMQVAHQALLAFEPSPGDRAIILREEEIPFGGGRADCFVVSIQGKPSPGSVTTWWVDKIRYVVLREDIRNESGLVTESASTLYTTVSLNEPLPDALFTFTPPRGARLVQQIGH